MTDPNTGLPLSTKLIVLIIKDEATQVPREVADLDEARVLAGQGMRVEILHPDGDRTPVDPFTDAELQERAESAAQADAETVAAENEAEQRGEHVDGTPAV